MATLVLTAVGTAFAGPLGGALGGVLGGLADRALVSALTPARQVGARLSGLELHSTSVGAPVPCTYGRARVAAQTIWAARFREKRVEQSTGGGKGGGGATAVSYTYSLSFAVALGEGPIDGVGRIWADGAVMDLAAVTWRLHRGEPDQMPDALIEAVEGTAPAYRNTAYIVFEDLPLETWGNRPPQLNVEVFRRPPSDTALEARLTSVNLIPGAGEFVLSPTPELRVTGEATYEHENVHNAAGLPDLMVALDQLQAQLPKVDHVNLVVAWFGTDLRCGVCEIRPGVESRDRVTTPDSWRVEMDREGAHLISSSGGGPAYGGTPSDSTVLGCIAELGARGIAVTLYPFLMMDVPAGNALPDPYGGPRQAAYPWRGRITGAVAPGLPGTPDRTAAATAQVASFFGAAAPSHFSASGGGVEYAGPVDWGYRRLVLHYARLAQVSAGVEGFLIGSELRGLTTLRSATGYPAVDQLRALATDVKAMVGPGVKVGYSGDWSEYSGHQPPDGSGDVRFHLDPLWADPAIGFVGVDLYQPLADWRGGNGGLDAAAGAKGPHDAAYLAANVLGGENADWFYASPAARAAQARTAITDGAYGEPWVFRSKDLRAWWSQAHHDRAGGVRAASPTAWTPGMKPLRLVELGCPAVDRGSNSPNLFIDPKSSESGLPIASTGVRDDLAQRRACEAVLAVYGDPANTPASPADGRPMIERMSAWCWDARPYPDFPARSAVWRDAPNWTLGHWLTGRVGMGEGADIVRALLIRAGLVEEVDFVIEGVTTRAFGYVVPGPTSTADALAPLADALGFDLAERDGRIAVVGRDAGAAVTLAADALALPDDSADSRQAARTLGVTPDLVRVRYLDEGDAYQAGSVVRRAGAPGGGGPDVLELPVVLDAATTTAAADRRLARALAERDALTVQAGPLAALRMEAGDLLAVEGRPGAWRVLRVDLDETPRLSLARAEFSTDDGTVVPPGDPTDPVPAPAPTPAPVPMPVGPPALELLDLPPLPGAEDDWRPLAAVTAEPWRPYDLFGGLDPDRLELRATATDPAVMGVLLADLPSRPAGRWDRTAEVWVRPSGSGSFASVTAAEVLNGANALAVKGTSGEWEVLQFTTATPNGYGAWRLSGLLRGQLGTEDAMGAAAGAPVVRLGAGAVRAPVRMDERYLPLIYRAAPSGGPAGGPASSEAHLVWRGRAWRPFAPAQLRAQRTSTGVRLTWARRARVGGDTWDGEVPLEEPFERYYVQLLTGAGLGGRSVTSSEAEFDLPDLSDAPYSLGVRVQQWGAQWGGYGGALERTLLF